MNYQKITKFDVANGPGIRTVLWVSGCNHHCNKCHNPDTWDPESGKELDDDAILELMESLDSDYIDGVTFSGGDPMYPSNRDWVRLLAYLVKSKYPNKSIWMYTGYHYDDIKDDPIFEYVDVLVDGPYIDKLRDLTLPYCGSRNQRVIDIKATRVNGEITLYNPI